MVVSARLTAALCAGAACLFSSGHAFVSPPAAGASARASARGPLYGDLHEGISFDKLDGSNVRVGIIKARWNNKITDSLHDGVIKALTDCGVKKENTFETAVPGAYELPLAARFLAMSNTVDCIVCLGCLVKGDTFHFEYIAEAVSSGLMQVGLSTSCPVVFGVLTTENEQQAIDRSQGENNHGVSWGMTAVEMGLLRQSALGQGKGGAVSLGFGDAKKVGDAASGDRSPVTPERVGF